MGETRRSRPCHRCDSPSPAPGQVAEILADVASRRALAAASRFAEDAADDRGGVLIGVGPGVDVRADPGQADLLPDRGRLHPVLPDKLSGKTTGQPELTARLDYLRGAVDANGVNKRSAVRRAPSGSSAVVTNGGRPPVPRVNMRQPAGRGAVRAASRPDSWKPRPGISGLPDAAQRRGRRHSRARRLPEPRQPGTRQERMGWYGRSGTGR